ncbi:alpha-lytic protease prodomain-containing protein [Streptomyces daghestanicus]|uniref:Peptidase S1A alpha-lytic prodomain domain-containing protein n=1 Tax=Streptomyces daghestanicus TaxID=66885 RepID=A0ABQ3QD99_9ACTN|nr:alpha-lytic protease prodomain-containing protein [Streptomyces daghestanicus]GGU15503.1 hypothetical protein GCM10010259_02200 [Streptomyces daghestanicus]GHI35202.1 hypothetical protein Sdagh_69320 [Streptomyces daghestanicus]
MRSGQSAYEARTPARRPARGAAGRRRRAAARVRDGDTAVAGEPAGPGAATPGPEGHLPYGGHWIGAGGRPVVAVTDAATAAEVRRADATARLVPHGRRELPAATAAPRSPPRVAGTAWTVDHRSNEVVVRGDRTVPPGDRAVLTDAARELGGLVRAERTEGASPRGRAGRGPSFRRRGAVRPGST